MREDGFNRRARWLNGISLGILMVVFCAPLGFLFEHHTVWTLGKASLVSPLPIPFREEDGYENYVYKQRFAITHIDGTATSGELCEAYPDLTGPHKRKIALAYPFSLGPRIKESIRQDNFEYLYCSTQYQGPPVDTMTVFYDHQRDGDTRFTLHYQCPQ